MNESQYNLFLKPKAEFNTLEFGKIVGNILHNFGMICYTNFLHEFVNFDEEIIENMYEVNIFHDLTLKEQSEIKKALSRISDVRIVEHIEENIEVV